MQQHLTMYGRLLSCIAATFLFCIAAVPSSAQTIEEDFLNPPQEAKALMIWQWMDGVVSEEGIANDLREYKEAGLGGVQQFLVGGSMQGIIRDSLNAIGTERWKKLMRYAIDECQRLGLSYGTHNCPGWSSSAFPTVEPQYSMQKLVWSDTVVVGGKLVSLDVRRPDIEPAYDYYEDIAIMALPADCDTVKVEQIVMLKDMQSWKAPKGRWRLMRFGHTTNGKTNYATSPMGGCGLECDKMSREAVRKYWETYPSMLIELAGEHVGKTFTRIEIDSYEAGGQDWTRLMPEEFAARRHYDLLPWLPVMAGVTVGDAARSSKFLKDFGETVSDLFAENYYAFMGELCHESGLQLLAQPYGTASGGRFNPINTNKISRQKDVDIICAEFWTQPPSWGWKDVPRVVGAARAANRSIIYAEGFTCWPLHAWQDDPASLKKVADRAFCAGINRLMLHAGAQNPWLDVLPGMTFGKWGTQWSIGQTWWRSGGARCLFSFFARCQALLQRGDYVDDRNSRQPSMAADEACSWIHRKDGDADFYFIANTKDSAFTSVVAVDGTGRIPEIWRPESGTIEDAKAWTANDGKTQILLHLDESESLFLVFRKQAAGNGTSLFLPESVVCRQTVMEKPWTVQFPEGWGAPKEIALDSLMSWDKHPVEGVRYFSGTARYINTFKIKKNKRNAYILDLGTVKNLARVYVNGRECAHLWKAPFRCDITPFVTSGRNIVEIEVTNLWPNRMIGDEQYPDDIEWGESERYSHAPGNPVMGSLMKAVPEWLRNGTPRVEPRRKTVASFKFFEKSSPLFPSGLLGPVYVIETKGGE